MLGANGMLMYHHEPHVTCDFQSHSYSIVLVKVNLCLGLREFP